MKVTIEAKLLDVTLATGKNGQSYLKITSIQNGDIISSYSKNMGLIKSEKVGNDVMLICNMKKWNGNYTSIEVNDIIAL